MLNRQQHNDGVHIATILAKTTCTKHNAEQGDPCWPLWITTIGGFAPAVCGGRIKRAGFDGKISPKSLSRWSNDTSAKPKTKTKYAPSPRQGRPQKVHSK